MKTQVEEWFAERGIENFKIMTSAISDALLVRMHNIKLKFYAMAEIRFDADSKDVDYLLTDLVERYAKGPDWIAEIELQVEQLKTNINDMAVRLQGLNNLLECYKKTQTINSDKPIDQVASIDQAGQ